MKYNFNTLQLTVLDPDFFDTESTSSFCDFT